MTLFCLPLLTDTFMKAHHSLVQPRAYRSQGEEGMQLQQWFVTNYSNSCHQDTVVHSAYKCTEIFSLDLIFARCQVTCPLLGTVDLGTYASLNLLGLEPQCSTIKGSVLFSTCCTQTVYTTTVCGTGPSRLTGKGV